MWLAYVEVAGDEHNFVAFLFLLLFIHALLWVVLEFIMTVDDRNRV